MVCCYFLQGKCSFGTRCRRSHDDDGTGCQFGESCHIPDHRARSRADRQRQWDTHVACLARRYAPNRDPEYLKSIELDMMPVLQLHLQARVPCPPADPSTSTGTRGPWVVHVHEGQLYALIWGPQPVGLQLQTVQQQWQWLPLDVGAVDGRCAAGVDGRCHIASLQEVDLWLRCIEALGGGVAGTVRGRCIAPPPPTHSNASEVSSKTPRERN